MEAFEYTYVLSENMQGIDYVIMFVVGWVVVALFCDFW